MELKHDPPLAISSYARALSIALGERDPVTKKHCDRVIELAGSFGRHCGCDAAMLRTLRLCALFHDIGKIGIPDRVLFKEGRFDEVEWAEMCSHPERGQRIVEAIDVEGTAELAIGVRHHHENIDGTGYPDGLAGDDIPFVSRVVSIIDGYDAMAMPRACHRHRGHAAIMEALRAEVGRKYDPSLFSRFEEMIVDSSRRAAAD